MKISDDELAQLQKLFADADKVYLESDKCHWQTSKRVSPEAVAAALVELQQLREERSWRDISELNEASAPQFFLLRDGKSVNPMPFWLREGVLCTWAEDQDGIGDVSIKMAQEWYTHFRPLPMDLPEGADRCR